MGKHRKKRSRDSLQSSAASPNTATSPSTNDPSQQLQLVKQKHAITRRKLPIYPYRKHLCDVVAKNEVVLVVAETGSGKSTQLPAYLYECGLLKSLSHSKLARSIAVTQPRRVAATTLGTRVAEEVGCLPGTAVGHRVRFDDCTDRNGTTTRILYVTDGMLLREATTDPLLSRYAIVVLDEAHERSLQTDVLFGVVQRAVGARKRNHPQEEENKMREDSELSRDEKIRQLLRQKAQERRLPPLKVIVMSATLDVETFQTFFPSSQLIKIPGRQFQVQVVYTREEQEDYIESALATALQIHAKADSGDVLVFLPGQEDIEDLASLLKKHLQEDDDLAQSLSSNHTNGDIVQNLRGLGTDLDGGGHTAIVNGVLVCVLYAALSPEAQMLAFQPKPEGCTRKIILATNIAETSVTLDGIRYVVDCGKHKTRDFSGATGMESLTIQDVSKAQAAQRTGRAGRVMSGVCFRLYTEDFYDRLEETTVPEILRVNLSQVVLQLKSMGVHDPRTFEFLTPPSQQSLLAAFTLLYSLGALDDKMELTEHGKKLARLPLDPVFGHLLLQSRKYECTSEMLTAVSMLSTENIFYRPTGDKAAKAAASHQRFASYEGDLPSLLNVYQAWHREAIYVPPHRGGLKAQRKRLAAAASHTHHHGKGKLAHGEWCTRNYINGRALVRAYNVRHQLSELCVHLGLNISQSCDGEMELFLQCTCAGLFRQGATRIAATVEVNKKNQRGNSGALQSSRGRYRTKLDSREVSIHPTSTLFGRNPAPKCVVYVELLTTKKAYIRGVTQVREAWLDDFLSQSRKTAS